MIKNAMRKYIDILKDYKFSILLYILLTVLLLVVMSSKINMSLDEVYTYGLSNYTNEKGIDLIVQENYKYEPAEDSFMEYVSATDRFNYTNVWKQQASDVHPPLYYALVHSICSLFPSTFSIWYAGVVNIFFSLCTLFFVQKLAYLLGGKNKAVVYLVSAMYVLCSGILFANGFLRMYMMAMCQVTWITSLVVKQIGEEKDCLFFVKLAIAATIGALIHYYCIVYTVIVCGVYFICLLMEKHFKQMGWLVITGAVSAGAAVAVFPAMIQHIFFSYRGEESFNNLAGGFAEYAADAKEFMQMLNDNLFGGMFAALFAVIAIMVVAAAVKAEKSEENKKRISFAVKQYVLVEVSALAYVLLVAKVAVYTQNRYIIPVYAVTLCGVTSLLFRLLGSVVKGKRIAALSVTVVMLVSAQCYQTCYKGYLYTDTKPLMDFAHGTSLECLYLWDGVRFHMMPSFMQVSGYKSVTYVNYNNPGFLWSVDYSSNSEIAVVVSKDNQAALQEVLNEYPQFTQCELIDNFGYATTYYLHG